MSDLLPLLKPHEREHTFCTFCPKLCRHACPVSTAQASETTTPWAKMTSVHHQTKGSLPHSASHAASSYACTGCLRCTEHCDHDNRVGATLLAARAEAVSARIAPAAAYELIESHQTRQQRAHAAALELFGDALERPSETVFFPGCTGCVTRPRDATAGYAAVEGLLHAPARVEATECCGLPLLEAGDRKGFLTAAERTLKRLEAARTVVFQDPGCLHALMVTAPSLGLAPVQRERGKRAPELLHLSQLADRYLARLAPLERGDEEGALPDGPVRYHDPCRLGRGLGVYDEPRRVLRRIIGHELSEFFYRREDAECSGGGGQLPRTDRTTADAIAKERLRTHTRDGGGVLVTACPGSARRFAAADGEAEVVSLAELIARSTAPR